MDYEFCYRLAQAPTADTNGAGVIIHDIWADCREEGVVDGWATVGGYHRGVPVPTDELKWVMDMPDGTGPEKQAKNAAYKQLLAIHVGDTLVPWAGGWSKEDLELYMDTNDACLLEAARADEYITVTLGLAYPVRFTL